MKISLFIIVASLFFQQEEIPLKPLEHFDLKLDYKFKNRPSTDNNVVRLDETVAERERRTSTDLLPYLVINIKPLVLAPEEVRYSVRHNKNSRVVTGKKVSLENTIRVDVGFTDDAKDRVGPHEYIVEFLSAEKKPLSKIVVFIDTDGVFLVNGQKRGKF